jgi:outer membrane protein assembly factor BamB
MPGWAAGKRAKRPRAFAAAGARLAWVGLALAVPWAGPAAADGGAQAGTPVASGTAEACARPLLAETWRADLGRALGHTIAVGESCAFAATLDGRVGAVNLVSGRRMWRTRQDGGVPGGMVVDGDRVLGLSDEPDGRLFCLDAATGDALWRADVGPGVGAPVVHGTMALCAATRGRVTACDLESGEIIWQRPIPGQIRAPLAVAASLVLVPTLTDSLLALAAATGDLAWSASPGGAVYGRPMVDDQGVWTLSYEGVLTCWDPATGHIVRRTNLDGVFRSAPVRAGDALVAVSTGGSVFAIDSATLAVLWRAELKGAVANEPLATDGLVWVALGDRSVRAVCLADGREVGRHELERRPTASPVRVGDLLMVGLESGDLVGLRMQLPESTDGGIQGCLGDPGARLPLWQRGALPSASSLGRVGHRPWTGDALSTAAEQPGLATTAPPVSPTLIDGNDRDGLRLEGWGRVWAGGWLAGTGVALWLQHEAEEAHDRYVVTGDPDRRREEFDRAERLDRATLATWIVSEAMFLLLLKSWLTGEP